MVENYEFYKENGYIYKATYQNIKICLTIFPN